MNKNLKTKLERCREILTRLKDAGKSNARVSYQEGKIDGLFHGVVEDKLKDQKYQVVIIQKDCVKGSVKRILSNKLSLDEADCMAGNKQNFDHDRFNRYEVELCEYSKTGIMSKEQRIMDLVKDIDGLGYGYIGNFERWGDDRGLYIDDLREGHRRESIWKADAKYLSESDVYDAILAVEKFKLLEVGY